LLEADLERYYGRELADEIERAGCRKLWVWVNGLPPEAAVGRVDGEQWTVRDELLATALERLDHWGLVQAHLNSSPKARKTLPAKSMEVPRPGEAVEREARDRVITDPGQIAQFFG
jgi:hypothetical protein